MSRRIENNNYITPSSVAWGIRVSPPKPLPPLAEYEAFLDNWRTSTDRRAKSALSASGLRRAVVMVRGGSSFKEIGEAVGCSVQTAMRWYGELTDRLKGEGK